VPYIFKGSVYQKILQRENKFTKNTVLNGAHKSAECSSHIEHRMLSRLVCSELEMMRNRRPWPNFSTIHKGFQETEGSDKLSRENSWPVGQTLRKENEEYYSSTEIFGD
jgi:hypothetical protein